MLKTKYAVGFISQLIVPSECCVEAESSEMNILESKPLFNEIDKLVMKDTRSLG